MIKNLLCTLILMSVYACKYTAPPGLDLNEKLFHEGEAIAVMSDGGIKEASGLVASSVNSDMFWTHNDSGDEARIFLIDKDGSLRLTVTLEDTQNKDWEDIAVMNTSSGSFLFIGDIGDNLSRRKKLFIYKIEEPKFEGNAEQTIPKEDVQKMAFTYENGARDAETLIYDHNYKNLVIVSKREKECIVYAFPFTNSGGLKQVEPVGSVSLTSLTGGDANEKGEILIKSYDEIFYWGPSDLPVAQRIIKGPNYRIPYESEPQGEAICWEGNGNFFTVSEFHPWSKQYLYFYKRTE